MTDTAPTNATPAGWAALFWPFTPIDNDATARRALDLSVIILLVNALRGFLTTAWSYLNRDAISVFMHNAMEAQAAARGLSPDQVAMAQSMADTGLKFGVYVGGAFVVVYLIAALIQWRAKTGWIPLVMALLGGLGIAGFLMSLPKVLGHQTPAPAWVSFATAALTLISLGAYINAFRARRYVDGEQ